MVRVASATVLAVLFTVVSCGGRANRAGHAGAGFEQVGGRSGAGGRAFAGEHGDVAGGRTSQGGTAGFSGEVATAGGGTSDSADTGAGRSAAGFGGIGGIGGVPSDAGQSAGGVAGGEAGAAGEPGTAGSGEFPARATCGTTYPPNAVHCDGLNQVTIAVGPFLDAEGNEGVSPGEDAKVVLTLHNTASQTFDGPCVGLLADNPAITELRGDAGDYNPWTKYFAILAGQSLEFRATFHVDERVAPGTVLHFVAWVTLQTAGCTNGNEVEVSLDVAP